MKKYKMYIQTYKDYLKRTYVDFFKRGKILVTPMQILISTLKSQGYLPKNIIAVELFGMHGLWLTKDYADICSYLELYEINPIYANFAKKFIRNAKVITGDSIIAVKNKQLIKSEYNFIVSDNPFGSPYGNQYFEHFDLFPEVIDYIDNGILMLNFIHNASGLNLSKEHLQKREQFYGKVNPSVKEAVVVYEKKLTPRKALDDYISLAKNENITFLALVIRKI